MDETPPQKLSADAAWRLIAVLFSEQPLDSRAALQLYNVAMDLYENAQPSSPIAGDLLQGTVRNLDKKVALGDITGPAFEAELHTEAGENRVRFLLTREAVRGVQRKPPRSMMN
jgi:hypothetical protein